MRKSFAKFIRQAAFFAAAFLLLCCAGVPVSAQNDCNTPYYKFSNVFPTDDRVRDVAVDTEGNVFVVGRLNGESNYGGTLYNTSDLFVAKYD